MESIYIPQQNDKNNITEIRKVIHDAPIEVLVEIYNRQVKCGTTGVYRQTMYLVALRQEFIERLKESPVYLIDYVLGLVGPIEVINGNIRVKK